MNTAKEEALQMLKNNSIKADETLKTKSAEKASPAKEKFSLLNFFDVSPAFEEDPENEAAVAEKLVLPILSLVCGGVSAYLISDFFQQNTTSLFSDKFDFLFGFVVPFVWIFACFAFGFVFNLKPLNNSEFPIGYVKKEDSYERLRDLNIQRVSSLSYSNLPGNIHYGRR